MSLRFVLVAVLLGSFVVEAKPTAKKATKKVGALKRGVSQFGEVTTVTASSVFVNRGAADGVKAGQSIAFLRGGKPAGACTVSAVSQHFARCDGGGLRVGDRFSMARATRSVPVGNAAVLPSELELRRRALLLEDTEWKLRDFDTASSLGSGSTWVDVALSHTTYFGGANGPFGVQRLDVFVPDVEIWKGLRVSGDITVLNFSARPGNFTSVYRQTPVLLVRQLEVGFRRADVPFSAALGRTWLRAGTGLLAIDGAQAAWKFGEGFELGAWGGLLPEAARLTITPSQWSVGAFGRVRASSGTGASATVFQLSLRGGWSQRDLLGGRAELGLSSNVWVGSVFDASLGVELGFGSSQAVAGIDAARLDFGLRPSEKFRVNGGVRYRGQALTSVVELGTVSPGQRAIHGDLGGMIELTPGLWAAVQSGVASDFDSGLWQVRVGPELSMPRLLGLPLGLGLGYIEEIGWLRGRHGYAQVQVAPIGWFRLTTRVNWFQQQLVEPRPGLSSHELGTSVALDVTPFRFIRGRVAFVGRVPLQDNAPFIGSIQAQLAGGW